MADSLVTKAGDGDFIIGVTQEEHTGEHDELNSRSDGTKIRINIAPDAVYEVPLPSYTAKSGTATTIVTDSLFWLVKQYCGATMNEIFKYYTSATLIASVVALIMTYVLSFVM